MANLLLDYSVVDPTINKPYTFKDVSVDFTTTLNNRDIATNLDFQAIQGGIDNMFLFLKGERVLLPEFGNNLYRYLYEPCTAITGERLGNEILAMFKKWEPRVNVIKIIVTPYPDENTYTAEVTYSVPVLNKEQVLTFSKAINIRR